MFLFDTNLLKQEVEKYQMQSFESAKKLTFAQEKTQNRHKKNAREDVFLPI